MTKQTWSLIGLFLRQELIYQHKRELLGRLWLLIQPLVYIVIFMTIFSQLMGAKLVMRVPTSLPESYAYSIYLVSGLLAWQFFTNSVHALASVYQQKSALIRKVPISLAWFPLYIPIVELVSYVIAMLLFNGYLLFLGQVHLWQQLWLLPFMALLFVFAYAVGIIVALLTSFIPDVKRLVSLLLQLLFWATPIVYIVDILPTWAQPIVQLNPIYWLLENIQAIYLSTAFQPMNLVKFSLLTLVMVGLAAWLMRRLASDVRDLV